MRKRCIKMFHLSYFKENSGAPVSKVEASRSQEDCVPHTGCPRPPACWGRGPIPTCRCREVSACLQRLGGASSFPFGL